MNTDGYSYLKLLPKAPTLDGDKSVTFVLGTDRHLDEGTDRQEKRVGIIPAQVEALIEWLGGVGIVPCVFVVAGAGEGAGFSDSDYEKVGAKVVEESDLPNLPSVPAVVHSLKESFLYESSIPGPFTRIGALHTGQFDRGSGTHSLMLNHTFCGIFDGSCIGNYSYKFFGGFPTPIKSSMSVFAGEIGADQVADHVSPGSKIVISAGGAAGASAAKRLLSKPNGSSYSIMIVEKKGEQCERLREFFKENLNVTIHQGENLGIEEVRDTNGLILAAYIPGMMAPEVVELSTLEHMKTDGIIVDISCDEGVGIMGFRDPNKLTTENFEDIRQACAKLSIHYLADAHMPRVRPTEASECHGRAVLPYLAILLYLSARENGPEGATTFIQASKPNHESLFNALVSDLKNGLAFSGPDPIVIHQGIVKDTGKIKDILIGDGLNTEVR